MKIKYDHSLMQLISLFESLTGAKVKDCISDGSLMFIVEKGQMGLALGKNRQNLIRVEKAIKKKIKLVEFDDDVCKFVTNYVFPLRKISVSLDDRKVIIKGEDTKTRALLIGREKSHLKQIISVVKRFFDIEDVVVQ